MAKKKTKDIGPCLVSVESLQGLPIDEIQKKLSITNEEVKSMGMKKLNKILKSKGITKQTAPKIRKQFSQKRKKLRNVDDSRRKRKREEESEKSLTEEIERMQEELSRNRPKEVIENEIRFFEQQNKMFEDLYLRGPSLYLCDNKS